MSERYYVSCDAEGVSHTEPTTVVWELPTAPDRPAAATEAPAGGVLVLWQASALLDELETRVYVAEALEPAHPTEARAEVQRARIVGETAWDESVAAAFAIEAAAHVLGDTGATTLPNGRTLDEVLVDARAALAASAPEAEARLGLLARVRAARRLRREGRTVQEVALELLTEDDAIATAAIDDPAWTTVAAVADAVLAAVEALRAVALPRYVAAREEPVDATGADTPTVDPHLIVTPWGPMGFVSHQSPYVPAFAGARDAAARARDVARERGDGAGEAAERAWQAEQLERLLAR